MSVHSVARFVVERLTPARHAESLLGDLDEEYSARQDQGRRQAILWYCREALVAVAVLNFQRVKSLAHFSEDRRDTVPIQRRLRPLAVNVGRNALALVVFWLAAFALVQTAERLLGDWPATAFMELTACAIGVVVSLRLRAFAAAVVLAGQLAYAGANVIVRGIYDGRAIHGAPAQFTIMAAATFGVLLGVLLVPQLQKRAVAQSLTAARS
jgi:hypothetical protein